MNFKQLEIFLEVARQGTFSEAARTLYISQPTISVQIAALEKELGVSLFERQGRLSALAPAGKVFLKYAADIVALRDKAAAAMKTYRTEIAGNVDIWASSVPADYLLPRLLPTFLRLYPQVFVQCYRSDSQEVWDKVLSYEAELGVVGTLGDNVDIEAVPVRQDEVVVIAPPGGKYRGWPEEIRYQCLLDEPLVFRELGSGTQKTFDNALRQKGCPVERLNIKARFQSAEALKAAVAAGLGIGVISELAVGDEVGLGRLCRFRLKDLDLRRRFYLITHRNKVLSPAAETFKRFILQNLGEETQDGLLGQCGHIQPEA